MIVWSRRSQKWNIHYHTLSGKNPEQKNNVSLGHSPPSLRWFCRSLGVTGGDFEQNPVRIKWKPRKSLKNQRNSMKFIKIYDFSRKFPNLFSTQKLKNKVFSMIKLYFWFRIFSWQNMVYVYSISGTYVTKRSYYDSSVAQNHEISEIVKIYSRNL